MSPRSLGVVALVLLGGVIGCSRPQPTPPEVTAEFEELLQSEDGEWPGASVARLEDFKSRNEAYEIVAQVDREIDRLAGVADGRYHEARELAREGEFDRAEAILEDLATHMPETSAGESAREHLAFDFHFGKAQWLMVRQRWEESGEVARVLLDRDLTREQKEKLETILDNAGHVSAARSQADRAQAQVACRHIVIYLEMRYAEYGEYPPRLTLSDVEEWDPQGSRSVLRALASIEDYQRTDRGVSFTAVSTGGQHRIRVVDGEIER